MKIKMIELGYCAKPHGIKGELSFHLYNDNSRVLKKGELITLMPSKASSSVPKAGQEVTISSIAFGNKVICRFNEISDRNTVEAMIPFKIFYPRERLPQLAEGEFYYEDLVGLKILDNDRNEVGTVVSYFENGAQIVLTLNVNGEVIELPFVEAFFPKLDLKNKTISFIAPEYL